MYRIAAIDVHKRVLVIVVADVTRPGEFRFERRRVSATPDQLRLLAQWLIEMEVEEVVMESTAQYWRPVWEALERYWQPARRQREGARAGSGALHLAQAKSNRGPRGRKNDFADAERLLRRLIAGELILSFVPDAEQRLWRTLARRKLQLTRDRVELQNQLEALLEEAHIKLSGIVSDLLGVSARRILGAMAAGEADPKRLAELADFRLRATAEELEDALSASASLNPVYRRLLGMMLAQLNLLELHRDQAEQEIAALLAPYREAVERLAEVPGLGVDSAQQILAEVGPTAATFPSPKHLASWVGVCPGENQSAGVSSSSRSPKGNRNLRRLLNQAAHAAIKVKGSVFEVVFRRLVHRMAYQEAIWAIAHRICRVIWKILHRAVRYEERGPSVSAKSRRARTGHLIRELRRLGYRIEPNGASTV